MVVTETSFPRGGVVPSKKPKEDVGSKIVCIFSYFGERIYFISRNSFNLTKEWYFKANAHIHFSWNTIEIASIYVSNFNPYFCCAFLEFWCRFKAKTQTRETEQKAT